MTEVVWSLVFIHSLEDLGGIFFLDGLVGEQENIIEGVWLIVFLKLHCGIAVFMSSKSPMR